MPDAFERRSGAWLRHLEFETGIAGQRRDQSREREPAVSGSQAIAHRFLEVIRSRLQVLAVAELCAGNQAWRECDDVAGSYNFV